MYLTRLSCSRRILSTKRPFAAVSAARETYSHALSRVAFVGRLPPASPTLLTCCVLDLRPTHRCGIPREPHQSTPATRRAFVRSLRKRYVPALAGCIGPVVKPPNMESSISQTLTTASAVHAAWSTPSGVIRFRRGPSTDAPGHRPVLRSLLCGL